MAALGPNTQVGLARVERAQEEQEPLLHLAQVAQVVQQQQLVHWVLLGLVVQQQQLVHWVLLGLGVVHLEEAKEAEHHLLSNWKLPCNRSQGIGQALHCFSINAGLVSHCKDTYNLSTLRMLEQSKLLAATNPASTCQGMHTLTQEAGSKKSQPPRGC